MRRRFIGFVMLAALLIAGPAMAADPCGTCSGGVFDWNGPYAGVNIGGAWTSKSVTVNNSFGGVYGFPDLEASGVIGGGQIGYNWQCECWLFGMETDFQGADLSLNGTATTPWAVSTTLEQLRVVTFEQSMDWFGTLRGRVGWLAAPHLLIYVTGGFAYGDVENNTIITSATSGAYYSGVRDGWTAGGGVEWALSQCTTVKVEYLYMDLGSSTVALGVPAVNVEFKPNTNILRVGVNYKF